jgi:hypothetical protein
VCCGEERRARERYIGQIINAPRCFALRVGPCSAPPKGAAGGHSQRLCRADQISDESIPFLAYLIKSGSLEVVRHHHGPKFNVSLKDQQAQLTPESLRHQANPVMDLTAKNFGRTPEMTRYMS